jgi:hypothetical protein
MGMILSAPLGSPMLRFALLAALLTTSLLALADDFNGEKDSLSTQEKAEIKSERDEAQKNIDEKYKEDGTAESRHARQREMDQADQELAQKHGVSAKTLRQQEANTSSSERQDISEQAKSITEERKKKKAAAGAESAAKPAGEGEVEMVKGFSEDKPVDLMGGTPAAKPEAPKLDENGQPMPTVEKNIKGEDGADPAAAGADAPPKDDPYAKYEKSGSSHSSHPKRRKKPTASDYDQ